MQELQFDTVLRPVAWYKWVLCVILACSWALLAFVAMPSSNLSQNALVAAEMFWACLFLGITLRGLSWFRIELSERGARRRGWFRSLYIPWQDATINRAGYLLIITSTKGVIRINPFIYKSSAELNDFLSRYFPNL